MTRLHFSVIGLILSLSACKERAFNATESLDSPSTPKTFSGKDFDGKDCKVTIVGLEKEADRTTSSPTSGTSTEPGSYKLSFSVQLQGNKLNDKVFRGIEQGFVQREVQGDDGRYKIVSEKVVTFLRASGHDPSGFNNNLIEFGILKNDLGLGAFSPWGRSISIGLEESSKKPLYAFATASFPAEKYSNACLFE